MWKPVIAQATGDNHFITNTPNQDYAEADFLDEQHLIIAGGISDGMGSAIHSEVGAQLSVKTALGFLKNLKMDSQRWLQEFSLEQAQSLFSNLLKDVQSTLMAKAKEEGWSANDLHCTLSVFIATPTYLMAMQVGDGSIVIRQEEKQDFILLFQPHREYGHQKGIPMAITMSVISPEALPTMEVKIINGICDFICCSTDGLENSILNLQKITEATPFVPFFTKLENFVREKSDCEEHIQNYLLSERVKRKSSDDKTLLVCLRSPVMEIPEIDIDPEPQPEEDQVEIPEIVVDPEPQPEEDQVKTPEIDVDPEPEPKPEKDRGSKEDDDSPEETVSKDSQDDDSREEKMSSDSQDNHLQTTVSSDSDKEDRSPEETVSKDSQDDNSPEEKMLSDSQDNHVQTIVSSDSDKEDLLQEEKVFKDSQNDRYPEEKVSSDSQDDHSPEEKLSMKDWLNRYQK
ncbi:protein phosphatase 2C domain-containing protein [Geminocystis sp. GBBB08]|uniref:PP2C family serine/threonine-protein phosphatase n=1 Tax=Geminocystis sp. GBBB08 TaxID=2604140 RepID=UPI0027E2EA08|nr:protein phosphatase 2C domain-containing protein [Geminocystis sp. GBBB08]MBL1208227.1 hypothetical protein [Geminocystis sp. GBBB08]